MQGIRGVFSRLSRRFPAFALAAVLSVGCTGLELEDPGGDDGGTLPDAGTGPATDAGTDAGTSWGGGHVSLSGKATYDFVPATYSTLARQGTLAFSQSVEKPVRNAVVQLRQGTNILSTTSTDEQGNYQLSADTGSGAGLSVVVLAKTSSPPIQVEDNTDSNAIWALGGAVTSANATVNLHATHGWTGSRYDASKRQAAPFAVLDSMYTAGRAFLAVRSVPFPSLKVNWSPDNVPQSGDKAAGFISTSHYAPDEGEIYILGKEGVDTDEFDSHVIVHEWGHYLEAKLSRSDSIGGQHSTGDVLDPRVSFSEGYGNAVAAMVLPESMYVDTAWAGGTLGAFGFDAETEPSPTDDSKPGPFSESTVLRLLYDLYDSGAGESYDGVSLGLGPIYDVLAGSQRSTGALTTVGSFIAGLKAQSGVDATAVNTLLAHYKIGAITTEWGDGDTNLSNMYFRVTSLPYSGNATLVGGYEYNSWYQNQYLIFTGTGASVTVSATSTSDVGLTAYLRGQVVAGADKYTGGTETFTLTTQADATYVVVLTGYNKTAGSYSASLSIKSP